MAEKIVIKWVRFKNDWMHAIHRKEVHAMKHSLKISLLLSLALFGGAVLTSVPAAAEEAAETPTLQSVSAVAHNYGFGEAVSRITVRYPTAITSDSLAASDYTVKGKTIASAAVSTSPDQAHGEKSGRYVILQLLNTNPRSDKALQEDPANGQKKGEQHKNTGTDAPSFSDRVLPDISVSLQQTGEVIDTKKVSYPPSDRVYTAVAEEPEIAGFTDGVYDDPVTGASLPYHLYLPKDYDKGDKFPLIVFIPDASVNTDDTKLSLVQGNGGTIWASPEEQDKHPAIVLILHYPHTLVESIGMMTTDSNQWTKGLTLAYDTIQHIIATHKVDRNRVYGTGQSQGGMANIAISDRYPDLFAAQYLVACQWNVQEMAALKNKNLWILVSEGDTKAYPGMNSATALWEKLGTKVARASLWDSHSTDREWQHLAGEMLRQNARINYSVFADGNHMYTWTIAYNIAPIRNWLFTQTRNGIPALSDGKHLTSEEKNSLGATYLAMGIGAYEGNLNAPDYQKALAFFRAAYRMDNMKAARWIGLCYANGRGVKQDDREAAVWYRRAARRGDITGTWLLGECYEKGKGVRQDYQKAFALYSKAAERKDSIGAPAMLRLGHLYENGLGVPKDLSKAQALYQQAAAAEK